MAGERKTIGRARIGALTAADRDRVTAAVTRAEATTDGEIVTIVATSSDAYHDVALHYAVVAMLLLVSVDALWPGLLAALSGGTGWSSDPATEREASLFALLLGETIVFLLVRFAFSWRWLRVALTPHATRARRVRRRAIDAFRVGTDRRTKARVGILLYLSLDERMAEIVADEGIHRAVAPERWGEAMAALVDRVRHGAVADGMVAAVTAIGAILAEGIPKTATDANELPDQLIEL